jgi:hypothetical protein
LRQRQRGFVLRDGVRLSELLRARLELVLVLGVVALDFLVVPVGVRLLARVLILVPVFEILLPIVQVLQSAKLHRSKKPPRQRRARRELQNTNAAAIHNPIILRQLALLLENIPTIKASLNINHHCCPSRLLNRLTKSVRPNRRSGGGI